MRATRASPEERMGRPTEDTHRARETVQTNCATGSPVPTKLTDGEPSVTTTAAPQHGPEPRERTRPPQMEGRKHYG